MLDSALRTCTWCMGPLNRWWMGWFTNTISISISESILYLYLIAYVYTYTYRHIGTVNIIASIHGSMALHNTTYMLPGVVIVSHWPFTTGSVRQGCCHWFQCPATTQGIKPTQFDAAIRLSPAGHLRWQVQENDLRGSFLVLVRFFSKHLSSMLTSSFQCLFLIFGYLQDGLARVRVAVWVTIQRMLKHLTIGSFRLVPKVYWSTS